MGIGTATVGARREGAERDKDQGDALPHRSESPRGSAALTRPGGGLSSNGEPIELRLQDLEEDPQQPRQTFAEGPMRELTESVAAHGVKVPILVHRHPSVEGRYIINDGARRYRASKSAGKTTVLAVVTDALSLVEQIVVNKVRDDTPPRDKALAFSRLMKTNGWTQAELARRLKLSEAYVFQHLGLLHLPPPVAAVFDSGRCTDVTLITELVKAFKKGPSELQFWLANPEQEITRGTVRQLREFLNDKVAAQHGGSDPDGQQSSDSEEAAGENDLSPGPQRDAEAPEQAGGTRRSSDKVGKALILGTYERRSVRLITNRRWSAEGLAWVRFEDTGEEAEIELDRLKLRRLVEV